MAGSIGYIASANYLEHLAKSAAAPRAELPRGHLPTARKKRKTTRVPYRRDEGAFQDLLSARLVLWCPQCRLQVQLTQKDAVGCPGCHTPRLDAEPAHVRGDPQRQQTLTSAHPTQAGNPALDPNGFQNAFAAAATAVARPPRRLLAR